MSVCCECCVLSGRGLCDELITRPEKSYRLWCVALFDLETSWMRRPWPMGAVKPKNKNKDNTSYICFWFVTYVTMLPLTRIKRCKIIG
jgi:hypothetical protein